MFLLIMTSVKDTPKLNDFNGVKNNGCGINNSGVVKLVFSCLNKFIF